MAPILRNGCYCVVSLRTCTITLASIYLAASLYSFAMTVAVEVLSASRPDSVIGGEMSAMSPSPSAMLPSSTTMTPSLLTTPSPGSEQAMEHLHESDEEDDMNELYEYLHTVILTIMIFEAIDLILNFVNIIVLCLLIFGAAKRKAAYMRPWLFVGAVLVIVDFVSGIVFIAMHAHAVLSIHIFLDTPLVVWLWIEAWSLHENYRDMDRRNARSPVSMAAILENGDAKDEDRGACSVAYAALANG